MIKLSACRICSLNFTYRPECEACHNLYWSFEHTLTEKQRDELQFALNKKQSLPIWFNDWWKRIQNIKAFL